MLGRTRPNALAGLYRRFSAATDEWAFLSWARENKWDQDAGEKPLPNYFQVFGVDPGTFDVSADELEAKYKTLQKVLHPDKLGAAGNERGRTLGELYSAHVNEAYGTLRKPLSRANYILSQRGVTTDEQSSMGDMGFLQEIMEIRERLEEDLSAEDLGALEAEINSEVAKVVSEIGRLLEEDSLQDAKELTEKLKYYDNILDEILRQK